MRLAELARSQCASGVHSMSGAADIMPTRPSGGRSTSALGMAAASGSAEPGGTMRVAAGDQPRVPGGATAAAERRGRGRAMPRGPAHCRHTMSAGIRAPPPAARAPRRSSSFERNKVAGLLGSSDRARQKTHEFALGEKWVEQKNRLWTMSTGTVAAELSGAGRQSPKRPRTWPRHVLGVKIPRGRQQRQAGEPTLPAHRQCQREQAAHAVANHRERFPPIAPQQEGRGRDDRRSWGGDQVRFRLRRLPQSMTSGRRPRLARWRGAALRDRERSSD